MTLESNLEWASIRRVIARAPYCSIASIDSDGRPRITPIGSVYIGHEGKGFFLERFTKALPENIDNCSPITLMAVDTGMRYWLDGLIRGKFVRAPAIRLRGTAGPRRDATQEEQDLFARRVSKLRWTQGHKLLWRDFCYARDLDFTEEIPVQLGAMWNPISRRSSL